MVGPNLDRGRLHRFTRHVCPRAVLALLVLVLVTSQLTCDKNNPPFEEQQVSGTVQLPDGAPISPTSLTLISFAGSGTPAGDGTFSLTAPVSERQQLLFAQTANGNTVLIGYVDPASPGAVDVSPRSTATSLTLLNPALIGSSKDQRASHIAAVQAEDGFDDLVNLISNAILVDPEHVLDGETQPETYARAAELSIAALQSMGSGSTDDLVWHAAPMIEDVPGGNVKFVNRAYVHYFAEIRDDKGKVRFAHVPPMPGVLGLQLGWPLIFETPAQATEYNLGDGRYDILFHRGLDFSFSEVDAFFDQRSVRGQASLWNFVQGIFHLVDLGIGLAPTEPTTTQIGKFLVDLDRPKTALVIAKLAMHVPNGDMFGIAKDFWDFAVANREQVALLLAEKAGNAAASKFLLAASQYAATLAVYVKLAFALNNGVPFIHDLKYSWPTSAYSVSQQGGVLTLNQSIEWTERPDPPQGPTSVLQGIEYSYSAVINLPNPGAEVSLRFYWGDGTSSDWIGPVPCGTPVTTSHTFQRGGICPVSAEASLQLPLGYGSWVSGVSDPLEVTVASPGNQPPATPPAPAGPSSAATGTRYFYSFTTTDPDGNGVAYQFDYGSGPSGWSPDYYPSGMKLTIGLQWGQAGNYDVKVMARDDQGATTDWSPALQVAVAVGNSAPNTPPEPTGPTSGTVGLQYDYVASTTDPEGNNIRYIFDWADGTCDTTQYIGSGVSIRCYKTWWSASTYGVKVKAEDDKGAGSDWSAAHYVSITSSGGNNPPNVPTTPSGPTSGDVGTSYDFSSSATDPDGDQVAIRFDWGDGQTSNWSSLVNGGTPVTMSHSWGSANTYQVKAQAKDDEGAESNWSSGHSIQISSAQQHWQCATSSAPWEGRSGHAALSYNGRIWLLGGKSGGDRNDVWYSTDGVNWTQATASAAWSERSDFAAVVFDNKMWVLGGDMYSGSGNDVWNSTDGVSWTRVTASAPWSGRECHSSVVFAGKIWIIGGSVTSGYANDVWYSSDGANWTQATAAAAWGARCNHTSVAFDGKMWVLGGVNAYSPPAANGNWYSTDGVNWTEAASAPWARRYNHTSVVYDGKMWVIGGWYYTSAMNDVWYSSDGASWTQATSAAEWQARSNHASVEFGGKLWVIGGLTYSDVWYAP